jgi:hypothetical protein
MQGLLTESELKNVVPTGYYIDSQINNQGGKAEVFIICKSSPKKSPPKKSSPKKSPKSAQKKCNKVLRVNKEEDLTFEQFMVKNSLEIFMHRKFKSLSLAPELYDSIYFQRPSKGRSKNKESVYITASLMGRVDGTVRELLSPTTSKKTLELIASEVENIQRKMCAEKITHGDFHAGNIGYYITESKKMKFALIDFEKSMNDVCLPQFDLLQFLRTLDIFYDLDKDKFSAKDRPKYRNNIEYLQNIIYQLYTQKYGFSLSSTSKEWERAFLKMDDEYFKMFFYRINETVKAIEKRRAAQRRSGN